MYTSIVGRRDFLRNDQVTCGARFVAFVDRYWETEVWRQEPACAHFVSSRRNSRAPKILAHQYIDSTYSIWIDARIALKVSAEEIVALLDGREMAAFAHPVRNCAYDEAAECSRRALDEPRVIDRQAGRYRAVAFPSGAGLAECGVLIRKHTRGVEALNNYWWSEYCRHSVRDQISFMYSVMGTGCSFRLIPVELRASLFDILPSVAEAEPQSPTIRPVEPCSGADVRPA